MSAKKRKTTTRTESRNNPRTTTTTANATATGTRTALPTDYLKAWTGLAKEMGETAGEFVRRFGEEQQKNYEEWVATLQDAGTPRPTSDDIQEITERFQRWNTLAQEIGKRVGEAFATGADLQKELFGTWSQAASSGATTTPKEQLKNLSELTQKFWTGLTTDLFEKSLTAFTTLNTNATLEEFIKGQEEMVKGLSESFKKLTYSYLTSPSFVTLFGRTLDTALDVQRLLTEKLK